MDFGLKVKVFGTFWAWYIEEKGKVARVLNLLVLLLNHTIDNITLCISVSYGQQIDEQVFTYNRGSGGGRVVKLLACRARGQEFNSPASPLEFSEIGYLLLQSRDMAEILLKRRKFSIQPTNQHNTVF